MKNDENKFPNGVTSYLETFYEVASIIEGDTLLPTMGGRGFLWELTETITDKFELQYKDFTWDGEFYDAIDLFVENELKNLGL